MSNNKQNMKLNSEEIKQVSKALPETVGGKW